MDKVRSYIFDQEEHHKKISFMEEYNRFMAKHAEVRAKAR
jgi:hypothetical protein